MKWRIIHASGIDEIVTDNQLKKCISGIDEIIQQFAEQGAEVHSISIGTDCGTTYITNWDAD